MDIKHTTTLNTISTLIGIIIFIAAVFGAYYDLKQSIALIQQDVDTLKTNHLVHLQNALSEMKVRNDAADTRQNNMEIQLTRILTILGKE